MKTVFPISSAQAHHVLQKAVGESIRFCHASGVCVDVDEHGMQDNHTLWGDVQLWLGPSQSISLRSHNDKLTVGDSKSVPDLDPALGVYPRQGVFIRGLGDFTDVTALHVYEDAETSSLIIGFEAGNLVVFEACAEAISVTFPQQNTTENSLWAARLQAVHHA